MFPAGLDGPFKGLATLAIGIRVLAIEEGIEATSRSEVGNSRGLGSGRNGETKTLAGA